MDRIRIEDLEIFAYHGVFPEENTLGQKFVVSADLYTDTRKAGLKDDLAESIHYGEVCAFMELYLKKHTYKLLESAAEHLAEELLLKYESLKKIRLEIKKPWAPIRLPLKTVSVEIVRGKHTAYIALGSNMGDREAHIQAGIRLLSENRAVRMGKVSDMIVTEPYGGVDKGQSQRQANGKTVQKWVPKNSHGDNHYLDAEVYAMAAADIRGARTWHLERYEPPKPKLQPVSPEEQWINENELEGWM